MGTVVGHRYDDGQSERDGAANGVAKDAKGEYSGMEVLLATSLLNKLFDFNSLTYQLWNIITFFLHLHFSGLL